MGQLAVLVLERLLDLAGADGGQLVLPGAGAPGPYRQRRSTVWPGYEWASTDELVAQVTKTQGRVLWRTSTRPRATLGLPFLIRGEVLAVAVLDKDWDEDHFTPTLIAQLETLPPVAAVFLQSALNASQRELWLRQEKLAGLGVLTGVVAHEINNPNHVIAMNSAFLSQQVSRHEPLSQPVRATWLEVLAETRHAAERISALTKDLKSLVRPRLEHRSLALAELLPSWVNTARNTLGGRLRSLTLDLPAGLPEVHGEAERLRQVVLNLIENSVQAGSEAGSEVRVWAIAGPEELRLSVSDDGCGMDEVTRIRALDPFFTTRARQGGTGLGLYLVQTIVTEHGGRVELASQPGKGTTVTVVLPIVGTTLSVL
jgi:signal transduction histidine kinase